MVEIPTPGRIVRFCNVRGETLPAIVTGTNDDGTLNLTAFGVRYAFGSEGQGGVPHRERVGQTFVWWWPAEDEVVLVPEEVAIEVPITQEEGQAIVDAELSA
jgi:hypothetical protein